MNKEVIFEICDICEEIAADIGDHLDYLKISVYKHESIITITDKIEQLRILMESIPVSLCKEPFLDYDAENLNKIPVPGECSFSIRVKRLLVNVQAVLQNLKSSDVVCSSSISASSMEKLRKHKESWQSNCAMGSKCWKFLQEI